MKQDNDVIAYFRDFLPGGSFTRGKVPGFYVATALDRLLAPRLLAGDGFLAVLSGNAGDGKTAFIQGLLEQLGQEHKPDVNVYEFEVRKKKYRFVLDGSEETKTTSNEDLLRKALSPYRKEKVVPNLTTVIAVNKGSLLSFLERERQTHTWLWREALQAFVDEDWEAMHADHYALIDLNDRSLFANGLQPSVFSLMVRQVAASPVWLKCRDCGASERCPVRWNIRTISRDGVAQRIETLLKCIDLDDRLHFTSRHAVTVLIGMLLSGKRSCAEVQQDDAGVTPFYEYLFDACMFPEGSDEEDAIREVDPAWSANPRAERTLLGQATDRDWSGLGAQIDTPDALYLRALVERALNQGDSDAESQQRTWRTLSRSLKRRDYFLSKLPYPASIALPFRYQDDFNRMADEGPQESDKEMIVRAINSATGIPCAGGRALIVPPHYSPGTALAGWGRLIYMHRITLLAPATRYPEAFLEYRPRRLELHVSDPQTNAPIARLKVSLMLYEMLRRAEAGFLPVTRAQKDYLARLGAFFDQINMVPENGVSDHLVLYSGGQAVLIASRPPGVQKIVLKNCNEGMVSEEYFK